MYKGKYSFSQKTQKAINEGGQSISLRSAIETEIRMISRRMDANLIPADLRPGYQLKLDHLNEKLKNLEP